MADSMKKSLRVLELYSGIGGMHWALKESGVPSEVVMAVDINTTANKIYHYNFPLVDLHSFGIEKLTLRKLESLRIDAILMSPPCQPFTRVGKKGDCDDIRTKSFLHLLELIKGMSVKPTYILVENVKGFETSQTRQLLLDCLLECEFHHQEFLLTPLQFDIPNCRLRYYMVARRGQPFSFGESSQILTELPCITNQPTQDRDTIAMSSSDGQIDKCSSILSNSLTSNSSQGSPDSKDNHLASHENSSLARTTVNYSNLSQEKSCDEKSPNSSVSLSTSNSTSTNVCVSSSFAQLKDAGKNMRYCEDEDVFVTANTRQLSDFMEKGDVQDFQEYRLTDKQLRLFVVMDIVFPPLKKSLCFTKRYGHYVDGAGSVVQMSTDVNDTRAASEFKSSAVELKNSSQWGDEEFKILRKLNLRYFTPREVANLLCYPPHFGFPDDLSAIQKYRCLGNSLNVHVVAELIKYLVS